MLEAFTDGAHRRDSVLKTDRLIKALELATLELATFESTTETANDGVKERGATPSRASVSNVAFPEDEVMGRRSPPLTWKDREGEEHVIDWDCHPWDSY
jgi:hypothetical protein